VSPYAAPGKVLYIHIQYIEPIAGH
jgi:hypothetical protein